MRTLNKNATGVLNRLVEDLPEDLGSSIEINNAEGTFMAVHVSRLTEDRVAVAHYGTQQGDVMRDPEMEFVKIYGKWHPASIRQDYAGRFGECLSRAPDGGYMVNSRLARELCQFADYWFNNIRRQQGIHRKFKVA